MNHLRSFTALAVLVGSLAATPGPARADEKQLSATAEAGRQEFNTYCVPCHGEDAKGHGVAALALKQQPADLTLIAARRDGRFDRAEIAEIIDGREKMPAHGTREMPIWGNRLGDDAPDEGDTESLVQGRVALLVAYLETIQQPGPAGAKGVEE
jgi:mono/diheme cytochrome c family protein